MGTGKELRRKAFGVARQRYDTLWPILDELNELEAEQRQAEAEAGRGRSRAEIHALRDAAKGKSSDGATKAEKRAARKAEKKAAKAAAKKQRENN